MSADEGLISVNRFGCAAPRAEIKQCGMSCLCPVFEFFSREVGSNILRYLVEGYQTCC